MAVFQTKKILSISAFIIVLIVILWLFQDNITKIYMLQQYIQQSDNI